MRPVWRRNVQAYEQIQQLVEGRRNCSDAQLLAELAALTPLTNEDDPAWDDEGTWQGHAYVYLALGDLVRALGEDAR
jgi:VanZ family protein